MTNVVLIVLAKNATMKKVSLNVRTCVTLKSFQLHIVS